MKQILQFQPSEMMCGLHSNIPLCCVMWYETGWNNFEHEELGTWLDDYCYVPCPNCVALILEGRQKPNIIKGCSCGEQQ